MRVTIQSIECRFDNATQHGSAPLSVIELVIGMTTTHQPCGLMEEFATLPVRRKSQSGTIGGRSLRQNRITSPRLNCEKSSSYVDTDVSSQRRVREPIGWTQKRQKTVLKVGKFNGTSSVDTFLIQFERCADCNCRSETERATNLKSCLSGTAGQVLWESGDPGKLTYKELAAKLKGCYGSAGQRELFWAQLRARRRRLNYTVM